MAHTPVLLKEVVKVLDPEAGEIILDGTLGQAGHAKVLAEKIQPTGLLIGLDRDKRALAQAKKVLQAVKLENFQLFLEDFRNLDQVLRQLEVQPNKILLDLGWNLDQLNSGKGFSFQKDEELLMTFDDRPDGLTAKQVVNTFSETELVDILADLGEEKKAKQIAEEIVKTRRQAPIETTGQLVKLIERVKPKKGKLHPATQTFQALRMVVNEELSALIEAMEKGFQLLQPKGIMAIITFHSLEDRLVKKYFKKFEDSGLGQRINKKVIKPEYEEIKHNRSARSAKLRAIKKI